MNQTAMGSLHPPSLSSSPPDGPVEHSQALWLQGDWQSLCRITRDAVEHQPQRGELALFTAAAHHQLGHRDETLHWSRLALDWGCNTTELARILISGVHNTLGRCAALLGDPQRTATHFHQAVISGVAPEPPLACHSRTVCELAGLGLMEEATGLVERQIQQLQDQVRPGGGLESHVTILKSELEILKQELSLAQRRGQLRGGETSGQPAPTSLGELEARWLEDLRKQATSQIGQDLWVLEKTRYKRGGYFVEFGATDGILLSNTHLLEKEFGWRGLCAEPNPRFFKELEKNRLCTVANTCIGATTGERVEFIFADAYGGMAHDADSDNHKAKREAYRDAGDTATLTTISLHDFLKAHNAPKTIDFISIDTEGSEFSIIETFPFEQWDVRILTIEHNFTEQRAKIRALLEARGYVCHEAQWDDWFYKREEP